MTTPTIEQYFPSRDLNETIPTWFNLLCYLGKLKRQRQKTEMNHKTNIKSQIYQKLAEIWKNENLQIKSKSLVFKQIEKAEKIYDDLRKNIRKQSHKVWLDWKKLKDTAFDLTPGTSKDTPKDDKVKIDFAKNRTKIIPTRRITNLKRINSINQKAKNLKLAKYNKRKQREKDRENEWQELRKYYNAESNRKEQQSSSKGITRNLRGVKKTIRPMEIDISSYCETADRFGIEILFRNIILIPIF